MKSQAERRLRVRPLVAIAAAAALLGAAACAAKVADKAPPPETQTEDLAKAPHEKHIRGPVRHVLEVVRQQPSLTDDQRATLDLIESELEADRSPRRALHEKLKTTAAAVVRSGRAGTPEFDQSLNEAVRAFEARVEQNTDALEEIHAILSPEQRKAVAKTLHEKIDERFGKRRDHADRKHDRFQRFASQLMLSTLQVDKLKAMKKELIDENHRLRPTAEELHALVSAFEGDDFSKALHDFHAERSKIIRARLIKASSRTDDVLSVFTPEQREILADMIEQGPRKVLLGDQAAKSAPER